VLGGDHQLYNVLTLARLIMVFFFSCRR